MRSDILVSIQGEPHSFSHQATKQLFQTECIHYRQTFAEVFQDLATGKATHVVVPIENSTRGSIYENYDNMTRYHCVIVGEAYIRITLAIIGLPGATLDTVTTVYSHPIALEQIQAFREKTNRIEYRPYHDTAGAVRYVQKKNDIHIAACANPSLAKPHNLSVLHEHVEENSKNFTRFFALTTKKQKETEIRTPKTTIQFRLGDEIGSLANVLTVFANHGVPLTRIESRPILHTDWEYRFYVDALVHSDTKLFTAMQQEIEPHARHDSFRVLGTYEQGSYPYR